MIDTKCYSVTGPNGFRHGGLTQEEADAMAQRMRDQARVAGWRGTFRVYYRDGSCVSTYRVG